jgi:hypothetical protein
MRRVERVGGLETSACLVLLGYLGSELPLHLHRSPSFYFLLKRSSGKFPRTRLGSTQVKQNGVVRRPVTSPIAEMGFHGLVSCIQLCAVDPSNRCTGVQLRC